MTLPAPADDNVHPIDPAVRAQVLRKLADVELEHGVRVLYACESGSRGWGFASPDSDYDVRFIFVRPVHEYLRISPVRDVIEEVPGPVYDVNGWDLRKALGREEFQAGGKTFSVTMSAGVATSPAEAPTAQQLVRVRDRALRHSGRLEQEGHRIHAESRQPLVEPVAGHLRELVPHRGVRVQVTILYLLNKLSQQGFRPALPRADTDTVNPLRE